MQSGTVPGTSLDIDGENQERNEDRSQIDSYPEVDATVNRSSHTVISDPDAVLHNGRLYSPCVWKVWPIFWQK